MNQMTWLSTVALGLMLVAVAVIDLRHFRIPNLLTLPLNLSGLLMAWFLSKQEFSDHVIGAVAGYCVLALFGAVYFRLRGREGLGLGDAKLFGAAGAWTGWAALPFVLLIAASTGLLVAWLYSRSSPGVRPLAFEIPFGPHIAVGLWVVWLFGTPGAGSVWR